MPLYKIFKTLLHKLGQANMGNPQTQDATNTKLTCRAGADGVQAPLHGV